MTIYYTQTQTKIEIATRGAASRANGLVKYNIEEKVYKCKEKVYQDDKIYVSKLHDLTP